MNAQRTLLFALFVALASGCQRKSPLADVVDAQPPTSPVASLASPATVDAGFEREQAFEFAGAATAPPTGPAPSGAIAERKRVLAAMFSGAHRVSDLPEVATEPGVTFDRGLRRRLTTVEVAATTASSAPLRGVVNIGAASASVPISDLDRVVAGLRPRFRRCYQVALDENPKVKGTLVMKAVVEKSGEVTDARAATNSGLPETVASCVAGVIRRALFSSPQSSSIVSIPITMQDEVHDF